MVCEQNLIPLHTSNQILPVAGDCETFEMGPKQEVVVSRIAPVCPTTTTRNENRVEQIPFRNSKAKASDVERDVAGDSSSVA